MFSAARIIFKAGRARDIRRSGDGPRASDARAAVRTAPRGAVPRGAGHDEETLDRVVWLDPRRDRSRSLSIRNRAAGRRDAPLRRPSGVPRVRPHADLCGRRPPVGRARRVPAAGRAGAQGRPRGRDAAQRAGVSGGVRRARADRRGPGQRESALYAARTRTSAQRRGRRSGGRVRRVDGHVCRRGRQDARAHGADRGPRRSRRRRCAGRRVRGAAARLARARRRVRGRRGAATRAGCARRQRPLAAAIHGRHDRAVEGRRAVAAT